MKAQAVYCVALIFIAGCGREQREPPAGSDALSLHVVEGVGQIEAGTMEPRNDAEDSAPSPVERTLLPTKVKLFYKDYEADPELRNYEANAFVLADLPPSKFPLRDTLNLLHAEVIGEAGQTESPTAREYQSKRFRLVDVKLDGNRALLTFEDPAFFTSGGSARVLPMRDRYVKTALQFREVATVEIQPVDVFQP